MRRLTSYEPVLSAFQRTAVYSTEASKAKLIDRLAEYEDTGFTPEAIRDMYNELMRIKTAQGNA